MFFLLECTASLTVLYSFPTRRSSDLLGVVDDVLEEAGEGVLALGHDDQALAPASCSSPAPRPDRDRKSTRLNSSHVEISYAVFCLKKKKPEINTAADPSRSANALATT